MYFKSGDILTIKWTYSPNEINWFYTLTPIVPLNADWSAISDYSWSISKSSTGFTISPTNGTGSLSYYIADNINWSVLPQDPTLHDHTAPSTPRTFTMASSNPDATSWYTNTRTVNLSIADVTDPSGVSWFVSESSTTPTVTANWWVSTKPTSYTITWWGDWVKTVYVYVKDNSVNSNLQTVWKNTTITLDTVALTNFSGYTPIWEDLHNFDTVGAPWSWYITFNKQIASVISISYVYRNFNSPYDLISTISQISDPGSVNWTIDWTNNHKINITYIRPSFSTDDPSFDSSSQDMNFFLIVKDLAWNKTALNPNSNGRALSSAYDLF